MMCKKLASMMLGAGLLSFALGCPAAAGTILVFGQTGTGFPHLFSATRSGGTTTLSAIDIPITITGIDSAGILPLTFPNAYLWMNATNTGVAAMMGGRIMQDYSGSFASPAGPAAAA